MHAATQVKDSTAVRDTSPTSGSTRTSTRSLPRGGPRGLAAIGRRVGLALAFGLAAFAGAAHAVPTPLLTPSVQITRTAPITFDVNFQEPVTGFEDTDIDVVNGTAGAPVDSGSGQSWTFEVTPTADGPVVVTIPAGVVIGTTASEPNLASLPETVVYDTTGAIPVLTSTTGSPTAASPLTIEVDFGENTSGFLGSDLIVQNGLVGNFTNVDGSVYEVEVVSTDPAAVTTITVELPAAVSTDIAGNDNAAGNTLVVEYDPVVPTPVFATSATNPTATSPIPFSVDFGETVTGLVEADFTVTGGTLQNLASGDQRTWTFEVVPPADGEIVVALAADAVTDAAANASPAAETRLIYAASAPIPAITSAESPATSATTIPVSIDFGTVVTGFDESDLAVTGASVQSFAPAGDSATFTLELVPTAEGTITIDIAAAAAATLAAVDTGAVPTFSIVHDTSAPQPTISIAEPDPTTAASWTVTIDFGEVVTGVGTNALRARGPSDPNTPSGSFGPFASVDGQVYTTTFTPNRNLRHTFSVPANVAVDAAGNASVAAAPVQLTNNSPISLSGIVYLDDGVTPAGAGTVVSLLIEGVPHATSATTDAAGFYEILDADIDAGDLLALYLDGNTEAGVAFEHPTLDRSIGGIDIRHDATSLRGAINGTQLETAAGSSTEILRVFSTQPSVNPAVGSGVPDYLPVDGTTLLIREGGIFAPQGDLNPNVPTASDFDVVVEGVLNLLSSRSRLYVSGDLLSSTPGDDRGPNGETFPGQILTNRGATDGSTVFMGFEGSESVQVLSASVDLDAFEYGGATTAHTLCFLPDEEYAFERFAFQGNPAPEQHLLRTCTADGTVLNDGSQHQINARNGNYDVRDIDYRDSNNISGVAINPGGDSVDSGNSLAWLGAEIAGTLYQDLNDNGQQDLPTEPGIAGIEIDFYTDDGNGSFGREDVRAAIPTVTTDANGDYRTTDVAATTYFVAPKLAGVTAAIGDQRLFTEGSEGQEVTAVLSGPVDGVDFGYGACSLMVDTTTDTFAGDGLTSFAEALHCADSGDTIGFAASLDGATVLRNNRNPVRDDGIYVVDRDLNINTVDTRAIQVISANLANVFVEQRPALVVSNSTLHVKGLDIVGGRAAAGGASLRVSGTNDVLFEDSQLRGSTNRFGFAVAIGGAGSVRFLRSRIANHNVRQVQLNIGGSVDVEFIDSSINNNATFFNGGGGRPGLTFLGSGDLIVRGTTIARNGERGAAGGGGIWYAGTGAGATFEVSDSTIAANSVRAGGSGIHFVPQAPIAGTVTRTTIAGNATQGSGAAVWVAPAAGGAGSTLTFADSVVSDNLNSTTGDRVGGQVSDPNGLITWNRTVVGEDLLDGTTVEPIGPASLGALGDYNAAATGTIGETYLLQCGSPLLDIGATSVDPGATDQNGRPRLLGDATDLGATEYAGGSSVAGIRGAAAPELFALGEELVVTVEFCSGVVYTANGGDLTIGLDVAGNARTATLDVARTAAAPGNTLVFSWAADAGLLDLDGVDVVANSLTLSGGATLRGPADDIDVTLTHAGVLLANDQVDTFPPVITLTDDIAAGPVGNDILIVDVEDVQPDPATYAYGFSADAVCDASDDYPIVLIGGVPIQFSDNTNNGQYLCISATDAAGNRAFALSSNALFIDTTVPVATITTSEPQRTAASPIPFTITFNEDVFDFDASDIQVANATAQNFVMVSATEYTVELVPPPAGGLVRLTVPANAAVDNSGLGNDRKSAFVVSDVSAPQPVISFLAVPPVSSSPFQAQVDFGEAVNGFTLDDIVAGNATLGNLVNNGNRIFTFTVTPDADGVVTLDVAANVARDFVGLDNLVAVQASIAYDATPPVPTASVTGASPTNGAIDFRVVFDEAVSGLDGPELVIGNGTLASLVAVDAFTYDVTVTAAADGAVTLAVPGGVAQDTAGNSNAASNVATAIFDGTGPAPVIASTAGLSTNASIIPVSVTWPENVAGFDAADLVLGNATLVPGSFAGAGSAYGFALVPTADGPVTVDVPAAAAADALGNPTEVAVQFVIQSDSSGPLPVLSSALAGPTSANPIPVTVTFPEDVAGVELGDFVVGNGAAQNLAGGPAVYTLELVPAGNGAVTLDLPAAQASDLSGNASLAAVQLSIVYDDTVPTPVITSSVTGPTATSPVPIDIDFQEPVSGLVEGEIVVTNGMLVLGSLADSGDGQNYTASVTPTADGPVTVTIAAGVATDASSNPNSASNVFEIERDTTGPAVVIASIESSPTNAAPIPLTVTFDEAVTGLELADFVVDNGTLANLASVDGIVYTMELTGTADGPITVDLAAATATDAADNGNTAAAQFVIELDASGPTPVIASSLTGPTGTTPIPVTVDFGEPVDGFDLGDLVIGNAGVSNFTDLGNGLYSFELTPNDDGPVTVDVAAAAATDATGNPSLEAAPFSIAYDGTPPTPVITSAFAGTTNASPIPIAIDFGEPVTGFVADDVTVTNAVLQNLVADGPGRWTADLLPVADGDITVDIAASVATDAAGFDNLVATTYLVTYDSRVPVPVLASTAAPRTGISPFPITIDFSPIAVTGFDASDLVVVNGTASNVQSVDNIVFTADITPTAEGVVEINVPGGAASSAATGTVSVPGAQLDVVYDLTAPTPVITSLETSPTGASPIRVSIDFGEPVTGFDVADLVVGNGTAANLVDVNGARYTVDITPDAGGEVTVDVPAAAAADATGLDSLVATRFAITFDDGAFSIADTSVDERAGTVSVVVTLDGTLTGGTTIDWSTADGSATAPDDYTAASGTLSFAGTSGETQTLEVPIATDAFVEGDETFRVIIASPSNALARIADDTADVTITDDTRLEVEFASAASNDAEDAGGNLPALVVSGAVLFAEESVTVTLDGGSATAGDDFTFASPVTVSIPAGDYRGATEIAVPGLAIVPDTVVEADETIELALGAPSGSVLVGDADADGSTAARHVYTIANDDAVLIELAADTSATETAGAPVPTLLISGTVTAVSTVEIVDAATGTATIGADYAFTSPTTLAIPAGVYDGTAATAVDVTGLTVVDDAIAEADESVVLALGTLTGDLVAGDADADGASSVSYVHTIENDDTLAVEFVAATFSDTETSGGTLPMIRVSGGLLTSDATIDVVLDGALTNATPVDDFTFVSPRTVTVPAGNYGTPATLAVGGLAIVDDSVDEGDEDIAFALASPTGDLRIGTSAATVYTIEDDDAAGVSIVRVSNLTSEAGASATFTAVLDTEPSGDVTLAFASSDTSEGSVPASVSFDASDWSTPKTVTVTGVDDTPPVADGTRDFSVLTDVDDGATTAAEYAALEAGDIDDPTFQNQDDDAPSVMVAVVDGETSESGGDTATLLFTLGTRPVSDVTIPLEIDATGAEEGSFADGTGSTLSSVTVRPDDWNTGVAVTVYGVDDTIPTLDGDRDFTVRTGGVSPDSDTAYLAVTAGAVADPVLRNRDDDAVTVAFASDAGEGLESTADGQPRVRVSGARLLADESVTVTVTGGSASAAVDYLPDVSAGAGSIVLTVPAADYTTAVDLALPDFAILDDRVDESDETIELAIDAVSSGLVTGAITARVHTVLDDDTAAVLVTEAVPDLTTESGGQATFGVALGSEPAGDVVVTLVSDTPTEGTPDVATLAFTAADWNVPQSVTVTGVDDDLVDGTVSYRVLTAIDAASTAPEYLALVPTPFATLQNQDDDAAAILVEVLDAQTSEGGDTATVRFSLSTRPASGDVTIPLSIDEAGEGSLDVTEIVVANADWNDPAANVVTVTGLDDDTIDGTRAFRLVTGDPSSANAGYDALEAGDVADPALENVDDDVLELALAADNLDVDETAGSATPSLVVTGGIAPVDFSVDVAISPAVVNGASDPSDFTAADLATFTIPAGDYRAPVTLELPGLDVIDDRIVEADELVEVRLQNPSTGATLAGETPRNVMSVTLVDDDEAGYVVGTLAATLAEDDSTTLELSLANAPIAPVTLRVATDADGLANVSPATLTFDANDWQTPRTVTISGIPDEDFVEESLGLTVSVEMSSDVFFRALAPTALALRITEPALVEDSDDDGTTDAEECGGPPCRDTDDDGIPDFLDPDDDDDGVPSREERTVTGTDPLVADTDEDLVPDGVEVAEGTPAGPAGDPDASLGFTDTDEDLVPDFVETTIDATDPEDVDDFTDTDGGGLPDYVETTFFPNAGVPATDPSFAGDDCRDFDADGLPDALELRIGSDFRDGDSPTADGAGDADGDTVPDSVEAYLATLTLVDVDADTDFDRDGLPDAFEVGACTNPLAAQDPDSDDDGVPDAIEKLAGSDIDNTTDSDGDGLPDVLEISIRSDRFDANGPTVNGAMDADGDGISDAIEAYLLAYGNVADTTNETDTDGDRVDDATEVRNNSNPFSNLQPVVWVEARQDGLASRVNRVARDGGTVTSRALIGNFQAGDREYDWSGTDASVLAVAGSTDGEDLTFDPSGLAIGVYTLEVRVRRIVQGMASPWSTVRYPIEVLADGAEVILDADADGIHDPDDRSDGRTGRADELQSVDSDTAYIVRSDRGTKLQLGSTTRTARHVATFVTEADIAAFGDGNGFPAPLGMTDEWDFPIGLHDFEVANLPAVGASTYIVIPQAAALPEGGRYLKFVPGEGYVPFDTSGGDEVASAPGTPGLCPLPDDLGWVEGLAAGDHCIRLTLTDAGPNDADGELNGLVVDPGGVAVVAASVPVTPAPGAGETPGTVDGSTTDPAPEPAPGAATPDGKFRTGLQGGGCSILPSAGPRDPILPLLVLAALFAAGTRRRIAVRHRG